LNNCGRKVELKPSQLHEVLSRRLWAQFVKDVE
jgi:hypothetical protein